MLPKSLIAFLLLISMNISASTYFISADGSDSSSGSANFPWATIQKGVDSALHGDTVFITEGSYREKIVFHNSGLTDNPIVICGIGEVVIKGTIDVTIWSGIFNVFNKKHITIRDIKLQDSYWYGFYIDSKSEYINIINCSTFNTGASGIYAGRSSYIIADSNIVRKACYQSLEQGSQECISFVSVEHFQISYNEIFESGGSTNGGEGIDTKEGCKNGIVKGNYVHNLERLGIYADAWDNTCENIQIYNNRVFNCASGIAISSENNGTVRNIRIYNNLVSESKLYGIAISAWEKNGPRRDIKIVNNTCFKNGSGSWGGGIIIEENANADSIIISNNLCTENYLWGISAVPKFEASVTNNLIYPFIGYDWTNEVKGTNSIISNPMLGNPALHDFTLNSNSPAIQKGTSTNAPLFDFNETLRDLCCVDIGAYHYTGTSTGIAKTTSQILQSAYFDQLSEDLIIQFPVESDLNLTVSVVNQLGLIEIHKTITSSSEPVSLKSLSSGCYIIKIISKTNNFSLKVIK